MAVFWYFGWGRGKKHRTGEETVVDDGLPNPSHKQPFNIGALDYEDGGGVKIAGNICSILFWSQNTNIAHLLRLHKS